MVELPTNTAFVVTGNNITADIDLTRRLLEVRLAPTQARPEQRPFAHPDVAGYVLQNRARWMRAALAVLQGSRAPVSGAAPSGFHQWDQAVRWPLVNAGLADPVAKFEEVREKSPDHERQAAWMLGLAHGFGEDAEFRAKDLVRCDTGPVGVTGEAFLGRTQMYADYLSEHPPAKGWDNVRSIGWMLDKLVGRVVEGYTLRKKTVKGTSRYTITRAGG